MRDEGLDMITKLDSNNVLHSKQQDQKHSTDMCWVAEVSPTCIRYQSTVVNLTGKIKVLMDQTFISKGKRCSQGLSSIENFKAHKPEQRCHLGK